MTAGVVLFAHGSRDPEWSRPLERIAEQVRGRFPGTPVELAFLEHGPELQDAAAAFAGQGLRAMRIVPVFLGMGGHLKEDLPRLAEELRRAFPGLDVVVEAPIGERPEIIAAIAAAIPAP